MTRCFTAATVTALSLSVVAQAATLYGVGPYRPFTAQALYQIDPGTGNATLIGNTGIEQINGIAWNSQDGKLYAYTTDAELYTLDLNTGAGQLVADESGILPEGGLAFNPQGALYANNATELGTVDLNTALFGVVGPLGSVANDVSGLAFDAQGVLFGYAKNGGLDDSLLRINPSTGAAELVGMLGFNSSAAMGGLDFDPLSGQLYLSDHAGLYTVETNSGAATYVGAHGVDGMSGIAFVPEPLSAMLLAFGLLVVRRRA